MIKRRSLNRFAPTTASPVTMPRYSLIRFPSIFGVVVISMDGDQCLGDYYRINLQLVSIAIEGSVGGASCAFERVDTPRINIPVFLRAPLSLGVGPPVYLSMLNARF